MTPHIPLHATSHPAPAGGYREAAYLAYPIVLSMMSQTFMWLVDSAFLGRVSPAVQGAAGFAGVNVWLLLSFCASLGTGVNILVAQAVGSGNRPACGLVTWQGLYLSLLAWLPMLACGWAAPQIVRLLGPDPALVAPAVIYMRLRLLGSLPMLVNVTLLGFFRGLGDMRTPLWVTILINAVNVVLDYLLIFGHGGLPRLGITGAASATVISTAVGSLVYGWLFLKRGRQQGFLTRRVHPFDRQSSGSLVRLSLPVGLQSVLEMSAWTLFTVLVARLGTTEAASHQIALNLLMVAYMPSFGVSIAATTLVGQYLGADNRAAAWYSARSCLVLAALAMLLLGGGFVLSRHTLVGLFTQEVAVVSLSAGLVLFVAPFQLFQGLALVAAGAMRGAGDTRWPMLAGVAIGWGVFLPGAALTMFVFQGGVRGGWLAAMGYGTVLGAVMLGRLCGGRWQQGAVQGVVSS